MTSRSENLVVEPVARLIDELARLPGIGPKTASRLTFFLLRAEAEQTRTLAEAILAMRAQVTLCRRCYNITVGELCAVCT
ncbi:MAG: recombination protein RecR, partial [Chloroflexia bacterium]|nr:recombination protein RecR [Chloroflexia bacterium]